MSLIETFKSTFDCPSKTIDINNADLSFLNFDEDKVLIIKLSNFFNVIIASANLTNLIKLQTIFMILQRFSRILGIGKIRSVKENNI